MCEGRKPIPLAATAAAGDCPSSDGGKCTLHRLAELGRHAVSPRHCWGSLTRAPTGRNCVLHWLWQHLLRCCAGVLTAIQRPHGNSARGSCHPLYTLEMPLIKMAPFLAPRRPPGLPLVQDAACSLLAQLDWQGGFQLRLGCVSFSPAWQSVYSNNKQKEMFSYKNDTLAGQVTSKCLLQQ